ncbi:ABC transporter permease [Anaerocolumna xylanovorans]|uniref:ABC-2 type transport system permease protein n=1 Tax=Anaerocolumna xylanovorans DSM 12503 TaxID=1121345 RepID=A0A1M7XWW6_9FIRM|nr:ABC transporter permease [Anaerocolumna xylanovorans]SHO43285.1 ABC-2 type transport system permease protein [Anaerocolumna xylanovorans DSM 12503]
MPWAFIKNNFKLMFRNKWSLLLMLAGPILVIATLSSAFGEMMKSYTPAGTFTAGYSIEEGSGWEDAMTGIGEAADNNGIELREFSFSGTPSSKEIKDIFQNKKAAVFVELGKHSYHIYKQKDLEAQGGKFEYFFYQVIQSLSQKTPGSLDETNIKTVFVDAVPRPDSTDYYGIVQIVYFSWCGIIILSPLFTSEKKNRIVQRLNVSPVSGFSLYMGKVLPCIALTMLLTFFGAALCTIFLGVSWGNLPGTLLVMAFSIIASSLFSILIYYLLGNMAITIGVIFTLVWIAGYLGGSFETYIFTSVPDRLKELSPLYYINRTLVEYSTMGSSSFASRCLLYLAAISIVTFAGGLLLAGRRRKNL